MLHDTLPHLASAILALGEPAAAPPSLGLNALLLVGLAIAAIGGFLVVRPASLAMGFAVTVAMWTLSYVAMLQPGVFVGELLFAGVVACPFVGGFIAGRRPQSGARGVPIGLVSAVVNLMVLFAVVRPGEGAPAWQPFAYAAGLLAASAALGFAGERVGARRPAAAGLPAPGALLATVAAVNIFVMIVLGGLVTSLEAGLAVPDWPNSFGHNMLLYPVSEMKGGVFYEHSHRLFGMLVGIVVLASATTIWRTDRRPAPRLLSLALVVAVIAQGVLGGLRVTGNATDSMDPSKLAPSTTLAIVHGILAQCVLALAFVTAAVASPRWSEWVPVAARRGVRALPAWALAALAIQLFLGASMRHLQTPPTDDAGAKIPAWAMHGHITMAVIALVLVLLAGMRCGAQEDAPALRRNGKAVLHTVGLQFTLGILALVAVLVRRGAAIPWWEVSSTTAHQAVGALLFGLSVLLLVRARHDTRAA
ncbi:MAG: COX15/CtaA family protein [Phycisphaerales bacterium]